MLASGYLANIPTERIDIFVAGCSCVDFSNLNSSRAGKNNLPAFDNYPKNVFLGITKSPVDLKEEFVQCLQKSLDTLEEAGTGESSTTFLAALSYIIKVEPKIVILENVDSAPWASMSNFWFPRAGYAAAFTKVNSRMYYMPQTRQRGYLVAVHGKFFGGTPKAENAVQSIIAVLKGMERQASAPVTDFLLRPDDPRTVAARADLESRNTRDKESNWGFSQVRHQSTREEAKLSLTARPFSRGIIVRGRMVDMQPPSRSWRSYFTSQPARVLDFIDIAYLQGIRLGFDLRYKTWVLDVSQNVDRSTVFGTNFVSKFGSIGCLTPSGQPILTDQMRPITGMESLGLQGLPVDDLVLSTETQAQLQDLAGNAMTVTVIGSVILAALAVVGDRFQVEAPKAPPVRFDAMEMDNGTESSLSSYFSPCTVSSSSSLPPLQVISPWDLGSFDSIHLDEVLQLVSWGAQLCFCPHTMLTKGANWLVCLDCGATACCACRGNPPHRYTTLPNSIRISPAELQLRIGNCLPGSFCLEVDPGMVGNALSRQGAPTSHAEEVRNLLGRNTFFLQQIEVTGRVKVDFKSTNVVARLILSRTAAHWLLFPTRQFRDGETVVGHSQPIVRGDFILGSSLTERGKQTLNPCHANWSVWVPRQCYHKLVIQTVNVRNKESDPKGIRVRFAGTSGSSSRHHPFPAHVLATVKEQVAGFYRLTTGCGAPGDVLFVKNPGSLSEQFFFRDIKSTGPPTEDFFVFSASWQQLDACEYREVSLKTSYQTVPSSIVGQVVDAFIDGYWTPCDGVISEVPASTTATPLLMSTPEAFRQSDSMSCSFATPTLFDVRLDVKGLPLPLSTICRWKNAGSDHDGFYFMPLRRLDGFLRDISFACPSLFRVGASFLQELAVKDQGIEVKFCEACCIRPPTNHWHYPTRVLVASPWEDPADVEKFETKMKELPEPVAVAVKFEGISTAYSSDGILQLKFTLNSRTLPSRAMAHLAYGFRSRSFSPFILQNSKAFCEFDWRYHPEINCSRLVPFHAVLRSSKNQYGLLTELFENSIDSIPLQLPCFEKTGHVLRDDQVLSVKWMLGRETCPAPFLEKEIEELVLPRLAARIIGRAIFSNDGSILSSRGGVAAHDIGYGKTVVTIALLELRRQFDGTESIVERRRCSPRWTDFDNLLESFIHLKATLIIVPGHISTQWVAEFKKFGSCAEIVKIPDVKTLRKTPLEKLVKADVILVSESFFRSAPYLESIDRLGAMPGARTKPSSREARDRYGIYCQMIRRTVRHYLKNNSDIKETNLELEKLVRQNREEGQKLAQEYVPPSRRKKGANGGAKRLKTSGEQNVNRPNGDDEDNVSDDLPRAHKRAVEGQPNPPDLWRPAFFLENFSFARIVVDEYSYQAPSTLSFVSSSLAFAKWLLSGTPPAQNLANICDVGLALGIHVARPEAQIRPGLPSVTEGPKLHPMSASEEFRTYSTPIKSVDFVVERHQQGIEFVKNFYRSNESDNSAIMVTERVVPVRLRVRSALYYHIAFLQISDANNNLLQVPMDLRCVLDRLSLTAVTTGETASKLALTSIANGVIGDEYCFERLVTAIHLSAEKFGLIAKSSFDHLVWLLDRSLSVNHKTQADRKYATVRPVVRSLLANVIHHMLQVDTDFTHYGGQDIFLRLMEKIAPPTEFLGPEIGLRYVPSPDINLFDTRRWRRDMAFTFWLDWYDITEDQVGRMDHAECLSLASDLIILSYLHKDGDHPANIDTSIWMRQRLQSIQSIYATAKFNFANRHNTDSRALKYQLVGLPKLQSLDKETLRKFIMDCYNAKRQGFDRLHASRDITPSDKASKAELREICRKHNLHFSDADTTAVLHAKIQRYIDGMADTADFLDGRGVNEHRPFPMLNEMKKARGSDNDITIDEMSVTYQRYQSNLEDFVQIQRRVRFLDTVAHLVEAGDNGQDSSPGARPSKWCDLCLGLEDDNNLYIVVACGHVLCGRCESRVDYCAVTICPIKSCGAYCRNSPVLRWSDFTAGATAAELESCVWRRCILEPGLDMSSKIAHGPRSEKVKAIVAQVKAVPKDDQILLFVPFPWLASELEYRFSFEGISYYCLVKAQPQSDMEMAQFAERFKTDGTKVLMLNPSEVSCAGVNLTNANHVMFVSPFLEPDPYRRNQGMRQAVGRCVRQGQRKEVFVYHFMVQNTIEEHTLRNYAKTHPNSNNSILKYFETSPRPWWIRTSSQEPSHAIHQTDSSFSSIQVSNLISKGQHNFLGSGVPDPIPLSPATGPVGLPVPCHETRIPGEARTSVDMWQRVAALLERPGGHRILDSSNLRYLCWAENQLNSAGQPAKLLAKTDCASNIPDKKSSTQENWELIEAPETPCGFEEPELDELHFYKFHPTYREDDNSSVDMIDEKENGDAKNRGPENNGMRLNAAPFDDDPQQNEGRDKHTAITNPKQRMGKGWRLDGDWDQLYAQIGVNEWEIYD
ncbi:hypothetical protein VTK73DRAFT_3945 [Phialemonium thermophilum]|uniref:RING-type domain-containing protein n=1 Tax=Phialemonium thermophilum TaxID=223376 RepID=A0ABR3Y0W3_9PEZI